VSACACACACSCACACACACPCACACTPNRRLHGHRLLRLCVPARTWWPKAETSSGHLARRR
jgi:hypothetical protein